MDDNADDAADFPEVPSARALCSLIVLHPPERAETSSTHAEKIPFFPKGTIAVFIECSFCIGGQGSVTATLWFMNFGKVLTGCAAKNDRQKITVESMGKYPFIVSLPIDRYRYRTQILK
jgi:hypothetical protein